MYSSVINVSSKSCMGANRTSQAPVCVPVPPLISIAPE
jgi:hypothetical protein